MKPIQVNWNIDLSKIGQIEKRRTDLEYEVIDEKFRFIELLKNNLGGNLYFKAFRFEENEIFDCIIVNLLDIIRHQKVGIAGL